MPDRLSVVEPRVLTVDEAADLLRVSKRHVYEMANQGAIRSVRFGRRILIPREAIDELLAGPAAAAS